MKKFYVYILKMENNALYCGYTDDVERRLEKHKAGTASKCTRAFKAVEIVYAKEFATKSEAMKEEIRIKALTRAKKLELINLQPNSSCSQLPKS